MVSLGTPSPEGRSYRELLKDDSSPSPSSFKKDCQSAMEVSFEFAKDSTLTRKPTPKLLPRHSSTQSLDSLISDNGIDDKSLLNNQNRVAKVMNSEGGRRREWTIGWGTVALTKVSFTLIFLLDIHVYMQLYMYMYMGLVPSIQMHIHIYTVCICICTCML